MSSGRYLDRYIARRESQLEALARQYVKAQRPDGGEWPPHFTLTGCYKEMTRISKQLYCDPERKLAELIDQIDFDMTIQDEAEAIR